MSEENRQLRVGLPSGSLQEPTISLFAKAGFTIAVSSRSYKPSVDDPELVIRLLRAQEISRYVEHGFLDFIVDRRNLKNRLSTLLKMLL